MPAHRISIVTDEVSQDLDLVERFLGEHEVAAIEVRCVRGRRAPDLDPRDRATLVAWANRGAPVTTCVSPGLFKCHVEDAAEIDRQLAETLPGALELATALGAPFLIAFAFDGGEGHPLHGRPIEALRQAAAACAAARVTLLVENEPGFMAGTAAQTRALLDATDCGIGANWDPCNSNELSTRELAAAVELLGTDIRNVHVKNGRLAPGMRFARCCSLADGDIDWSAHVRQLLDAGYDGTFGIETHHEPLLESSARVLGELRDALEAAS